MTEQSNDRVATPQTGVTPSTPVKPLDKVPPWVILLIGVFLFLVAIGLYLDRAVGQQLSAFLMCVGLGLVFAGVGDQGELQLKSGEGGLSWLGGLTVPFARFVGGAAVSFLLLLILAFLAPWISLDSDRYARVLVRANTSLENYRIIISTNSAPLVGSTLRSPTDYEFVLFSSDLTPFVTDLTLRLEVLGDPSHTYLNSVEIPEIPIKLFRNRIGSAEALLIKLDLKNGTLKTDDACYPIRSSENTNPCKSLGVAGLVEPTNEPSIKLALLGPLSGLKLISAASAQSLSDVNSLISTLGSRAPNERTTAYSALLAKGPAIFPIIIPVMTELVKTNFDDTTQAESYYRFLNLVNLSIQLTNSIDQTNLFRSIIGTPIRANPDVGSPLIDGLAKLAKGTDRSLRVASISLLANIVDNNTAPQIVSALGSSLTDSARLGLLNVLVSVSRYACKENADAIKTRVDSIASQSIGPEFAQTNKAIDVVNSQLEKDQNRNTSCDEYWRKRG